MNIQDEAIKIHSKYGTTEKANYEIQLLCEKYAKEYHEQQLKILNIPDVSCQREQLLAFCDHLNTYAGMEEIRFDFMMEDFIDKSQ